MSPSLLPSALPSASRWRLAACPALLLALGCGAPEGSSDVSGPGLGVELRLSQAVASEVGSFQLVVLPDGQSRRCAELQRTCVNQQVRADEPLLIAGANKKVTRALRFSAALSGSAQELSADIPVGRNYTVLIEALSRTSPPRFLGSSCNYLASVSATHNERLLANAIVLTPVDCDPTIAQ